MKGTTYGLTSTKEAMKLMKLKELPQIKEERGRESNMAYTLWAVSLVKGTDNSGKPSKLTRNGKPGEIEPQSKGSLG